MLRWYRTALTTHPLLTQSLTTSLLFATGDTLSQHLVERRETHFYPRTLRMAAYGGFIFGPAATKWFGFLQRKIVIPDRPNLEIAAKVATDQCVFASTNLFVFLSTMAVLEGKDPMERVREKYTEVLKKNWMVWPLVQAVNFKFVPLDQRVLLVNVVSIGE
ncbi:hypothetical protein K470DRAFT_283091 [Piedraia hortae CBS 480.64]|uniref:Uncharacterized protein n=1 Tax=Piedraia hortae CBS 480.64 TaxID=1314780 RepID=A0A6A7BUB7_9PEZI|nr:hypothetical protein K470DRAFT_283091 [Piedraia hortae CBS 480.64]